MTLTEPGKSFLEEWRKVIAAADRAVDIAHAATVLEPQFLQELMGYTATLAGEALAGGGLVLLVVMPLGGMATGKFPARNLAAFGFV